MRCNIITLFMILAGLLLPVSGAGAVVIKSIEQPEDNYQIHHKIIIFGDLSSYRTSANQQTFTAQGLIDKPVQNKLFPDEKDRLTDIPLKDSRLETGFNPVQLPGNGMLSGENPYDGPRNIVVGSFLDGLKDDPAMRTIYFTSKDLVFSYKKKIANVVHLGFNMNPNDYKNYHDFWGKDVENEDMPLTEEDSKNLEKQSGILFNLISRSYKNIFYMLLALSGVLYLCFRYILNRYI